MKKFWCDIPVKGKSRFLSPVVKARRQELKRRGQNLYLFRKSLHVSLGKMFRFADDQRRFGLLEGGRRQWKDGEIERWWNALTDVVESRPANAPAEARCKASPPAGGSALCLPCATLYRPCDEWDSFHYGINRKCDACGKEALCAMMPNAGGEPRGLPRSAPPVCSAGGDA